MINKIKLTQDQANRFENLKKISSNETIVSRKVNGNYSPSSILHDLTLSCVCQALYTGYEIKLPPVPRLNTEKIDVSFNNNIELLTPGNEIYIQIKYPNGIDGFSIEEARNISDTLDEIIGYYYKYGNK